MGMLHCGDVVKGFPKYSDKQELGVVLHRSSRGNNYAVNWEHAGHHSWYEGNELELVQRCMIQVRKSEI